VETERVVGVRCSPVSSCVIACMAAASAACGSATLSNEVHTSGLVALIDVTAEHTDQAVVSADILLSGQHSNSQVVLEGGDRLEASSGGEQSAMESVGNGSYEARFARGEGKFVVGLVRTGDVSAPRSVGTLPPPFEITSNFGEEPVSRAHAPLTITWAPSGSGAETSIELEGDCIHSAELQIGSDPGTYVIAPGKLNAWKSQEKESCSVAVRVVQLRKGQADPALDRDSSVVLRQIRTARFVSSP
jgi:hypothetical protein